MAHAAGTAVHLNGATFTRQQQKWIELLNSSPRSDKMSGALSSLIKVELAWLKINNSAYSQIERRAEQFDGRSVEGARSAIQRRPCRLLEALRNWVASGPVFLPPLRVLRLEADVPNRSQRMFVQMSEQSRNLEYFVSPR
jgi:hypothetical protein